MPIYDKLQEYQGEETDGNAVCVHYGASGSDPESQGQAHYYSSHNKKREEKCLKTGPPHYCIFHLAYNHHC